MASTLTPAMPNVVTTPSSEIAKRSDAHSHRRRFIGPLPEELISQVINVVETHPKRKGWFSSHQEPVQVESDSDSDSEHSEQGIRDAIREHAHEFFLGHGGRTEDWHEGTERHVREEMWRLWRESQWGKLRAQRREAAKSANVKHWVGSSFDVGVFLGVDLLGGASSISAPPSTVHTQAQPITPSTAAGESFFTAMSEPESSALPSGHLPTSAPEITHLGTSTAHPYEELHSSTSNSSPAVDHAPSPAQSDTALVSSPPTMQNVPKFNATHSDNAATTKLPDKGKRKTVHYDIPDDDDEVDDVPPLPPAEVLQRTGDEVQGTSAGAAQQATRENEVKWGDVIMRDRMLVRVSHTALDSVSSTFDENQNRVTPHINNQKWNEYIVAWRKDRLELYRDHATPGKEMITGHKHLAFMIPLDFRTRLSLYSFVDLTFCITCPAKPLRARSKRRWLLGAASGTSIFIFKVKSRTRGMDWTWHLWRHLGGQLPPFLEIKAPFLDTRFKIDVPFYNSGNITKVYSTFTRANIISLCEAGLRDVPAYKALIEENMDKGIEFELAWRIDTFLDWIWVDEDVEGKMREWDVLVGLALKQANKLSHLELRVHRHRPTRVHLKDGTRLDEPPSIEGYLDRIRPNTQSRQPLYFATHDGWLFAMPPMHAQPPMPPGAPTTSDVNTSNPFETSPGLSLQEAEVRRGRRQIMRATGMTDLRSIVMVRRAFQLIPPTTQALSSESQGDSFGGDHRHTDGGETYKMDPEDTAEFWESPERTEMDDRDPGGSEVLAKSTEKGTLRMRRSFELVLSTGRVIRYEATTACLSFRTSRPVPSYGRSSLHHKKHIVVNLLDAYVVSGFFAAQHLPIGQYHPDNPPLARRYRDGLESDENEEDTLFMIWYRKNVPDEETAQLTSASTRKQKAQDVPPLKAKRKLGVFRTRSKLERDAWVWAINVEIDKAVRRMKEREERVRQAGELMKT
ncbi:hypothetical protein QCA50_006649 [Cerrena zonata]|uniref:PH domain-containing protein n=1 Tax=Cerrena zonata TaxID=2478898 RepID=A0AAW0GC60_9APHY